MHLVKQINVFDQIMKSPEKKENLWLDQEEILIEDIDEQYLINDYIDVFVRLSLNKVKMPFENSGHSIMHRKSK